MDSDRLRGAAVDVDGVLSEIVSEFVDKQNELLLRSKVESNGNQEIFDLAMPPVSATKGDAAPVPYCSLVPVPVFDFPLLVQVSSLLNTLQ